MNLDEAKDELGWLVVCIVGLGLLILVAYVIGTGRILRWLWRRLLSAWPR